MMQKAANGYDVIIVGGGPAGLCAAMYAGRGMLKALTIERGAPGGELLNTDLIEDYIGFESIKGWELAQKMAEHAKKFGAEIMTDTVEKVRKADDGWFDVVTARGKTYPLAGLPRRAWRSNSSFSTSSSIVTFRS